MEALTAAGLMTPAGQAAVDEARRNGVWNALDKSDNLELPHELVECLDQIPEARQNFEAFS
ncbi:MAG: hypothetical protein M3173_04740, partial [Chloroflexota bacterium]|nr:hypothetical protein [Chloroflexota bacterium]